MAITMMISNRSGKKKRTGFDLEVKGDERKDETLAKHHMNKSVNGSCSPGSVATKKRETGDTHLEVLNEVVEYP